MDACASNAPPETAAPARLTVPGPLTIVRRLRGYPAGAIAQLGERIVRNDEVGGSIPPGSTNPGNP